MYVWLKYSGEYRSRIDSIGYFYDYKNPRHPLFHLLCFTADLIATHCSLLINSAYRAYINIPSDCVFLFVCSESTHFRTNVLRPICANLLLNFMYGFALPKSHSIKINIYIHTYICYCNLCNRQVVKLQKANVYLFICKVFLYQTEMCQMQTK